MFTLTININIPALDALVVFLDAYTNQQGKIDALTEKITGLVGRLDQSEGNLNKAVEENKPNAS